MGRLSYFRADSAVNEAHKEAIETGFPCILLCKKVIGEGAVKSKEEFCLTFWRKGWALIRGRVLIRAWALIQGNTACSG